VKKAVYIRQQFERFLGVFVLVLMVSLVGIVVAGVIFRKAGASLVWYDEVTSILLAWLTFYGASLAALTRSHIGFPKMVEATKSVRLRSTLLIIRFVVVAAFFLLVAWAGWRLLGVLGGTALVSLPWVPLALAHSAIPVGALLFVAAEMITTVDLLKDLFSHHRVTVQ
jgi:TRAP-type C4-dicarboxylate transport system permease small subunit